METLELPSWVSKDEKHLQILARVRSGKARFYVVTKYIVHAKLYLLSGSEGRTRVIVGSANLSERAFGGNQPETLVKFDDDPKAWEHYNQMFDTIRDAATDEISLPEERIIKASIEISETPAMGKMTSTLIIDCPHAEDIEVSAPIQISRVEKIAAALARVSPQRYLKYVIINKESHLKSKGKLVASVW